jgi:hypothetical protein
MSSDFCNFLTDMGLLAIFTIFNGHGTPIAFYIVKGRRTFVKVSGYSVHVSFLLFRDNQLASLVGGDGVSITFIYN